MGQRRMKQLYYTLYFTAHVCTLLLYFTTYFSKLTRQFRNNLMAQRTTKQTVAGPTLRERAKQGERKKGIKFKKNMGFHVAGPLCVKDTRKTHVFPLHYWKNVLQSHKITYLYTTILEEHNYQITHRYTTVIEEYIYQMAHLYTTLLEERITIP